MQIRKCIQSRVVRRERESGLDCAGGRADCQPDPEELARHSESRAVAREALKALPEHYREVLVRFYLGHQSPDEICHDLGLTPTQFRLTKSRAKNLFGRLGKQLMRRRKHGHSLWHATEQPLSETCPSSTSGS